MSMLTIAQLFDLSGKSAIVTGGARGIGQAVALRLAEAGAFVVVADLSDEGAVDTADQIRARGGKALALHADTASVADAGRVVRTTLEAHGTVDILVNNAAIFPSAPALQTAEESWDQVLAVNLKGAFFFSQAAAQPMIASGGGGRIVNIASMDAMHPTGNQAPYSASKGAVVTLTRALALEWGRYGISVNAVAPGSIRTPGVELQVAATQGSQGKALEALYRAVEARVPLGRRGEPDDVARVVLFLASPAADYMTGSLVLVDGGYLLG